MRWEFACPLVQARDWMANLPAMLVMKNSREWRTTLAGLTR